MKRLAACGASAIYQITRAFRRGEVGPLHNPEFTIVEWYRTGATYWEQMGFVEELVAAFFAHLKEASALARIQNPRIPRGRPRGRLSVSLTTGRLSRLSGGRS